MQTLVTPVMEKYAKSVRGRNSKAFDVGQHRITRPKTSLYSNSPPQTLPILLSPPRSSILSCLISCPLLGRLSPRCTLTQTSFSALSKFTSCSKTNSPTHCMKLHFKRLERGIASSLHWGLFPSSLKRHVLATFTSLRRTVRITEL